MIQVTKHGQENEISDKENDSDCDEDDNDLDDLDLSLVEDHEESRIFLIHTVVRLKIVCLIVVKHAWNLTAIVRQQKVLMRLQYFLLHHHRQH